MEFSSRVFSYDLLLSDRKLLVPAGELFQVSELSLIRGGEIAEHEQYCDEITYVVSGRAEFYVDGEKTEVSGGQVHYLRAGGQHRIVAGSEENFRYICIGFAANDGDGRLASYEELRKKTPWFCQNDDGSIKRLTELFLNEFYLEDAEREVMIDCYFTQLLLSLTRIYRGTPGYIDKKSSSTSHYAVYHALRYIDREYLYITRVKDVAKALSYTDYYLSHIFSEKVGMSIKEYITKKKMQAAAELLKTSNLSVDEVAEYLRFNTTHTFRQAFKKTYGKSPSEYRKG